MGPNTNYILKLGKYLGGLEEALSDENNTAFSTRNRDNDEVDGECAQSREGAWWYGRDCDAFDINSMLGYMKTKMEARKVLESKVF